MDIIEQDPSLYKVYYDALELSPETHVEEIKKSYRRLARIHHPDRHTGDDALFHHLQMVRINEAYRVLIHLNQKQNRKETLPGAPKVREETMNEQRANPTAVGFPKDEAYTYYKQGHLLFHKGFYYYYRVSKDRKPRKVDKLQAAIKILINFQKAYPYYQRVVEEYPQSMWAWDAGIKLRKIERLIPIYKKIKDTFMKLEKRKKRNYAR